MTSRDVFNTANLKASDEKIILTDLAKTNEPEHNDEF